MPFHIHSLQFPPNYIFFAAKNDIFKYIWALQSTVDALKYIFLPGKWKYFNFLPKEKRRRSFSVFLCFPSAGVVKTLKEMRLHSASGSFAHYHVLIACSMVQCVMRVHWSTKTHAISPSKRCLAMLHKAHLICITLALWCGIAYYINSCNLSNNFGSDLLHYQRHSSSNATVARLQFFPLFLYEMLLQRQIN